MLISNFDPRKRVNLDLIEIEKGAVVFSQLSGWYVVEVVGDESLNLEIADRVYKNVKFIYLPDNSKVIVRLSFGDCSIKATSGSFFLSSPYCLERNSVQMRPISWWGRFVFLSRKLRFEIANPLRLIRKVCLRANSKAKVDGYALPEIKRPKTRAGEKLIPCGDLCSNSLGVYILGAGGVVEGRRLDHRKKWTLLCNDSDMILPDLEYRMDLREVYQDVVFCCFLARPLDDHNGLLTCDWARYSRIRMTLNGDSNVAYVVKTSSIKKFDGHLAKFIERAESRVVSLEKPIGYRLSSQADCVTRSGLKDTLACARRQRFDSDELLDVSIIVPTKDNVRDLKKCIHSLEPQFHRGIEIIIISNNSTDSEMLEFLEYVQRHSVVSVVNYDIPFNFSRLCNYGAEVATKANYLFLNDDVMALDSVWIDNMVDLLSIDLVGIIGAKLLYENGCVQHAGVAVNLLPGPGHPWRKLDSKYAGSNPLLTESGEVDAVTGACLLIKASLFGMLKGFDEIFPVTLNDVDLCLRAEKLGYVTMLAADAVLQHAESVSRGSDFDSNQIDRYKSELDAFRVRYGTRLAWSKFLPSCYRRDSDSGDLVHNEFAHS